MSLVLHAIGAVVLQLGGVGSAALRALTLSRTMANIYAKTCLQSPFTEKPGARWSSTRAGAEGSLEMSKGQQCVRAAAHQGSEEH